MNCRATARRARLAAASNRNFTLLWTGQSAAMLGNRITLTMIPVVILLDTRSASTAGLVDGLIAVAYLAAQLPAGWILDNFNRRQTMLIADILTAVSLSGLSVAALLGQLTPPIFIATGCVLGASWTVTRSGEMTLLPHFVEDRGLDRAVARLQVRGYAAALAGAPVGGVLLTVDRSAPFLASAALYTISALFTAALRLGNRPGARHAAQETKSVLREIRSGLAAFWGIRFVRDTTLLVAVSDLAINGAELVVVAAATAAGYGPGVIGVVLALGGLGGTLGAVATPLLSRRHPTPGTLAWVAPLLSAVGLFALSVFTAPAAVLGALYGLVFAAWPLWNAVMATKWLRLTPDYLRGRVQTVNGLVTSIAVPFAPALVGLVIDGSSAAAAAALLASILLLVALAGAILARRLNRLANLSEQVAT